MAGSKRQHPNPWPLCLGPRGSQDITELLDAHPSLDDFADAVADSAVHQPGKAGVFFVRIDSIMGEALREIERLRSAADGLKQ